MTLPSGPTGRRMPDPDGDAWPEGLDPALAGDLESPLNAAVAARDAEVLRLVREAILQRRAVLAFQPVVLAADPARVAFHEGLIRILDRSGRVIPARDFMPIVERDEIARQIDCLALDLGLQVLARNPGLRIAVNMSARSIGYPGWTRVLRRGLAACPAAAGRLILEITEGSAMLMPEIVRVFMQDWRRAGIAFALDDFGAGYTSFRYLREFYFDIVKLDGQFIRGIDRSPDNQVLTAALLSVADHLDMFSVAESVETAEEAAMLTRMGVSCMQGYHFGAPTLRPAWLTEARRSA